MAESGASMRATIIENIGKARALKSLRLTRPQPAAGEALVKVHATSVNPQDLLYRSGKLIIRKPMPHILGGDLAGEIVQIAEDVSDWSIGDRVTACFEQLGSQRDGGYAEFCSVPADQLVQLPDDLDYQAAVAAGASFAVAWLALISTGKIKKADRVVVHNAASCIGIAAVQIAHARGAQVIAISQGEFAAQLREVGADIVLEDAGNDLVRQVKVATDERGATLVLHSADVDKLAQSIDMLDFKGRLVIASTQPRNDTKLNLMDVYLKSLSILGSHDSIKPKDLESIIQAVAKGRYRTVLDEVMPLSQARQAHAKMERNPGFGKIILVPDSILEAARKPANWIPIE